MGYANQRHVKAVIKDFSGWCCQHAHVEVAKSAAAAWDYCGKTDTRMEGPMEFGHPPARVNVKGDVAARNKRILEMGIVQAVDEGVIPIEKVKQIKHSIELYEMIKKPPSHLPTLKNEWHWGPTGVGKSYHVRNQYPHAFIKSNDVWWDGYKGEDTVIIEEMGPKQIGGQHMK